MAVVKNNEYESGEATVKVHPELKGLIPALRGEERAQLEQNILDEGCRDALVVWDGYIIDGHNRYEICTRHGLPFKTIGAPPSIETIEDAKDWIERNQLGRRNLTLDQFKLLLGNVYNRRKKAHGGTGANQYAQSPQNEDSTPKKTSHQVAEDFGVSHATVERAGKFAEEVNEDPELKQTVLEGKNARKTQNKKKRKQRQGKEREQVKKAAFPATVICADCMDIVNTIEPVDLLIADPPYFTDGNYTTQVSAYLGKVKPTGQAYVFLGADPDEVAAYLSMDFAGMVLAQILVWNYNNTGQRQPNVRYNSNYQMSLYFRGKDAPNINKPSDGKHQYACQTINAPDGRVGDRYHKWQKPLELIERYILNSSNEGDFVFDPFVGTGTTVIAAAKLRRIAKGCDVDATALDVAVSRGCLYGD